MLPVSKNLSINEIVHKFGTPTSFKDIGRVSNGNMPLKPTFGLNNSTSCYAPEMNFTTLKPIIESILSQIDGVRFHWIKDYFIWKVEWGTPDKENGLDYKRAAIIQRGRLTANIAACQALHMFPHLGADLNEQEEELAKWSKMELRVYWDRTQEKVFIHLNRMTGCPRSHTMIWNQFKDLLDNI
jgi:hypothetical protein